MTEPSESRYTIEQLATAADLPVTTIRYYQSKRLIRAPRIIGRRAYYADVDLRRLQEILRLREEGFSLAAVGYVLDGPVGNVPVVDPADEVTDVDELVRDVFPDAETSPSIQNALALGLLELRGGRFELSDESYRPLVIAVLRMVGTGVPSDVALGAWGQVQSHMTAVVELFSSIATEHVYGDDGSSSLRDPGRFEVLVAAAQHLIHFAFSDALKGELQRRYTDLSGI